MNEEDSDEKRRQRSEEARRAALRQRIERQKERDRLIAVDIANVDKKSTKRIVFEDSDEEDDGGNDSVPNGTKASSSKRPKLFDSEDENDKSDEEVELRNRHSGPKGEKLMQMESRFNSDPRFKLDDKFAESDSDDQEEDAEKQEMKQEKDKNRELLSKILGKSVEEKKSKVSENALLKARPFTRFDPENAEHIAWMKKFEESRSSQKTKKDQENEEKPAGTDGEENEGDEEKKETEDGAKESDEEDVESDDENYEKAEIFFKMDEQFSSEMKERKETPSDPSTGGFSFLSMMGRKYNPESPEASETETESAPQVKSMDNGSEKSSVKTDKSVKKVEATLSNVKVSTKFFVDPFLDEKIKSLATNFRRTQTVEKVIDKWAPHRDAIFKLWKKQRRDAVKKEKDMFFSAGKRKKKVPEENGGQPAKQNV